MVIPVGPPGAQRILKAVKTVGADGETTVVRSDIFGGKIIPFVPCQADIRRPRDRLLTAAAYPTLSRHGRVSPAMTARVELR